MSSTSAPRLTSGRVLLRPPDFADAVGLAEQWADPMTRRWDAVAVSGRAAAQSRLARMGRGWERPDGPRTWVIDDLRGPDSPRYAGYIGLAPRGPRSAEVDYGLHPRARGAHVMSTALRLVCQWWFASGGARVTWWAEAGHIESWRVARSCGFTFEGTTLTCLSPPNGPVLGWSASLTAGDDLSRPAPAAPTSPTLDVSPVHADR